MEQHSLPYTAVFKSQTFTVRETDAGKINTLTPCRSSEDTYRLARNLYDTLDADKESFILLALNNKNRLLGHKVISIGSLTASIVHPREVFTAALYFHAAALIFVHNHPSGDPAPSPEDIDITRRLKECGDIFGIRILEHLIVGAERYFSFSDKGLL